MSLYIRNAEADRLARQLTERTGETLTEAVVVALRERLERTSAKPRTPEEKMAFMRMLQERSAKLPVLDPRDPDDILYDEYGLPK
ncbi:type II toxin-antitoxin system VapB family antitoxin [Caulobacter sp. 602-2]|uniref:Type II toxin-antitoxin system VapB family antitoxin n=1 Tax=Caulobacter sp. 602-2 TaxID=2710887 RepID=A0A6G4QRG4_9CAUL|nr:type II toxin-antitoxin system VapB family antitoxin [Caulobacter sp. 602-2]NGM48083.1 type II toxin-antitoxin system VapB family antitoxin [Caulobacter sp. 602-2]